MPDIFNLLLIEIDQPHTEFNYTHHPLGLMQLAAVVESEMPHVHVEIFHCVLHPAPLDSLRRSLLATQPQVVGFRSCSIHAEDLTHYTSLVRSVLPKALLIIGGPFASSEPERAFQQNPVDILVMAEGEHTLVDVLRFYEKNGYFPADLPGTVVKRDGDTIKNPPRPLIEDLDTLPYPDYKKIDIDDYASFGNQTNVPLDSYVLVQTSRGCPYACSYCHNQFGKQVRRFSDSYILGYMRQHYGNGIRDFIVVDDVFNVPLKAAKPLLKLIARELPQARLYFANGLRADQVDDELIELLQEAGAVMVALAVESASARLQKNIGKHLKLDRVEDIIEKLSQRFITRLFFMIGFPGETYEEAHATVEWSGNFKYALPALFVLKVFPGTYIYNELRDKGMVPNNLALQATRPFDAALPLDDQFYGDDLPADVVPLDSQKILGLRVLWAKSVFFDRCRANGFDRVLRQHLEKHQVEQFYRGIHHYSSTNLPFECFLQALLGKKAAQELCG